MKKGKTVLNIVRSARIEIHYILLNDCYKIKFYYSAHNNYLEYKYLNIRHLIE